VRGGWPAPAALMYYFLLLSSCRFHFSIKALSLRWNALIACEYEHKPAASNLRANRA
jgi:hypothetical protein